MTIKDYLEAIVLLLLGVIAIFSGLRKTFAAGLEAALKGKTPDKKGTL